MSLSSDRRQTVATARSLPGDPRVLLLDETATAPGFEQTTDVVPSTTSQEQTISSITGATDHAPRRPAHRDAGW
ncbi:hypothetical protein [Streptomyces sp. NPDC048277]|uniref:hypothetical protein n=1 Tax=Streptomyces sp. NPDC048277 TaxID=3155027 RepID=UPI0033D27F8D